VDSYSSENFYCVRSDLFAFWQTKASERRFLTYEKVILSIPKTIWIIKNELAITVLEFLRKSCLVSFRRHSYSAHTPFSACICIIFSLFLHRFDLVLSLFSGCSYIVFANPKRCILLAKKAI